MAAATSSSSTLLILFLVLFSLFLLTLSANGLTCSSQTFSNNKLFASCSDLPYLDSTLHWTYSSKSTLSLAFVAPPAKPNGWISWAINPTSTGMIGAQTLIAFPQSDGSITVQTFNITSYGPVEQSPIAFEVSGASAEYSGGLMKIFATVKLPEGMTKVNQVWQVGGSVTNGVPDKHDFKADNLNSKGTLDLLKGESGSSSGGDSRLRKKIIHGVLNAISWGILMPLGAIIARYLRTFKSADPAWFYLHASCQFSAYVIGVAGWATGLQLGQKSKGVMYASQRNIGIAVFCLASLQAFALFLRPKKDHKYRIYWNVYHHSVGYAVIVLSIINVFKGLDILDPHKKWRTAYITVISILGAIAVVLEVITWAIVLRRKSGQST